MTSSGTTGAPAATDCESCGQRIWVADRFCTNCGAATDSITGAARTSHRGRLSRHRDSFMGLAVLGAVVGAIALAVLLGGTEPGGGEITGEPPAETQESTATAEPQPQEDGGVDELALATPVGTPSPVPQIPIALGEFLADNDLGDGWMVTISEDRHPTAINLVTGDIVESEIFATQNVTTMPTRQGVVFNRRSGWRFAPWTGLGTTVIDEPESRLFGPVGIDRVFVDERVGPVIVTIAPESDPAGTAHAVLLEESKPVEISDIGSLLLDAFAGFGSGQLVAPDGALLFDDGSSTYRWTWDDEWSKVSEGRLDQVFRDSATVLRCDFPEPCDAALIDHNGNELGGFAPPEYSNVWEGNVQALSPDRTRLATRRGFLDPSAMVVVTELADSDPETRTIEIGYAGRPTPVWQLQWSPNGRYLFATTDDGLAAVEVETGLITTIGSARGDTGSVSLVFLDTIDR